MQLKTEFAKPFGQARGLSQLIEMLFALTFYALLRYFSLSVEANNKESACSKEILTAVN